MGENGSVEELLVQGHAKVVGNGTQVIVGDGLPDDAGWSFKHIVIFLRLSLYVQQHSYKDVRVSEYETRMFRLNGCVPINNLHRKS